MLLPATPGWVSLPVVVGGPRHSWLRAPGAVPRHSWLGSAGGGRVWWGWWLVCGVVGPSPLLAEVPGCYSPPLPAGFRCWWWCAVPRHSWLGPAGGGGAWCVVCGVWCVVCGVRRWCIGGVVAGVWCGWSLATPGGGSCGLLPATPGWVSLPVVVRGPRHSWLRAPGAVPRHSWLGSVGGGGVRWYCGWCVVWSVPRGSWRRFLRATSRHFWLGFAAGGGVWSPATPGWGLLAAMVCGVWCVVCGVWCAAVVCWWGCGWCVVWLVPRHSWRRFLCATPRHSWLGFAAGGGGRSSPLLADGPGRGSPPLLAGFRCRRWCVVCGVCCVVCGVRRWRVWWVCGWCVVWLVPRHSWRRFLCGTPHHFWLGFAAGGGVGLPATPGWGSPVVVVCFAGGGVLCCVCLWCVWVCAVAVLCCVLCVCGVCVFGGVVWWCGGCVFRVPFSLVLVCVCALCGPSCWCGWRGGGGACAVWLPCVCVCVLAVCGWWGGVCHTLAGSRRRSSAWFKKQKKTSCRCVAEMRGMRDA